MRSFYRTVFTGLLWLLALTLFTLAWNLKDPHLLAYRQYETATLLILAIAGTGVSAVWMRGLGRILCMWVLMLAAVHGVFEECAFRYRKHAVLHADARDMPQLGQHFVVGYDSADRQALRHLAGEGLIGGIFITRRNAAGRSAEELRQEIRALQVLRESAGLPPLIVATDQEGGIVSRLSPPLSMRPPLAALAARTGSAEQRDVRAEAYGSRQGQELAALGVTVNLSPVVDLKSEGAASLLDFHSLIGHRAISSDPAMTARVAQAYGRGLERAGVIPTLKHFPGLGGVAQDTHHFSAKLDTPIADLDAHDWVPFKQVVAHSQALIMLGHVTLSQVDRENPASFSHAVVQGILRDAWKHEGVLITDDLTMAAAYRHGMCEATVKALNAGVDLLLVSYDYEQYYAAIYCAVQAYDGGQLDMPMLERSRARLGRLSAASEAMRSLQARAPSGLASGSVEVPLRGAEPQ